MDSSKETEKTAVDSSSDSSSAKKDTKTESTEKAQSDDYKPQDIHVNMAKVTNVKKNKGMSYFGANPQAITRKDLNVLKSKYDKYAEERHFDSAPPGYYDYIIYTHRKDAYNMADPTKILYSHSKSDDSDNDSSGGASSGDINRILRIGDFFAVIPPEFISVTTKSTDKSIQPLRQTGSTKIENGYSKKDIQISLVLNGMDQINGYKVDGPMDYSYYVDGLRNLIAQMKFTPFVPVENTVINIVHGVSNVAIRNIYVETIPGFPEALQVVLTLDEFNATPYLRIPNAFFDNSIDWDLFRWYTQKPLTDSSEVDEKFPEKLHAITTSSLTSKFKFSIFKEEKIKDDPKNAGKDGKTKTHYEEYTTKNNVKVDSGIYGNIYDESSYTEFISSDDDITLTKMSFTMGNIMPSIQLSYHESPTLQFLGATDTEYSFTFQTSNSYIAGKFNELNTQNKQTIRTNRYTNGLGFLRIENELVQLTGINCVVLNDIKIDTVPGFPGLYSIAITCTSYDSAQANAEKLIGMRPFKDNREGKREDLISMQPQGYLNKVSQDATIISRFQELELYPDMHLPTYAEADKVITKIRAFRKENDLLEMPMYTKYPRHKCILPDSTTETEYEGFLDPDFYVMSLVAYSDITVNNTENLKANDISSILSSDSANPISDLMSKVSDATDLFLTPTITPDAATEPEHAYGYETIETRSHHGFLFKWENKGEENLKNSQTSSLVMSTGTSIQGAGVKMPDTVNKKTGNVLVDLLCDRVDAKCGYSMKTELRGGVVVDGRQYFDCSSFVSYGLIAIGALSSYLDTNGLESVGEMVSTNPVTDTSQLQLGDILVHHGSGADGHAALYIGNGQTAEASNSAEGCKYGNAVRSKKTYNRVMRLPNLNELNTAFLQSHPNFYGESGNSSSSSSSTAKMNVNGTPVGLSVDLNKISALKSTSTNGGGDVAVGKLNEGVYGTDINYWDDKVLNHAVKYNIDPNFIKAVMYAESSGRLKEGAGSDCVGLMQISRSAHKLSQETLLDADFNIDYGTKMLADFGQKYNYDMTKMLMCYNPGEGYVNSDPKTIALNGGSTEHMDYYINKIARIYADCLTNGGKSGSTNAPKIGGSTVTPYSATGTSTTSTSIDTTNPYNYTPEMFKNPNAGTKHGDKLSSINTDKYGTDFIEKIFDYGAGEFNYSKISESIKEANDENHVVEYMYKDSIQHNLNGLLVRAFPSYLLVFLDEQADWVDRKKLWTNYYVSKAAIDINIHESDDNPISVAQVSLTNFNGNLTSEKIGKSISTVGFDDDDWIREFMFKTTGTIFDEEISDKMIALKNTLQDEIKLGEGTRVHIRLGYGSDPSRYPTCFNGTIAEVNAGEVVTFVAQSDGCELMNEPLTDKTEDTNKDLNLGVEVSNIVTNLLVSRESGFLYTFSKGFFKYKSKYGIEHFGLHIHESDELNVGSALISIGKLITFPAASLIDIVDENMYYKQYDIVKNIYKGTYEGIPFCKSPYNPWDGEYNFRFFCSGKTPWDVMKMCEKAVPEFVAYPRYFGFESRMFYGLPTWLCKYDYVMGSDGIYEKAKSFAQVHEITSLDSIISNNIKLNSKDHNTNFIGIYSLGGDLSSTPVVMSDRNIDWSKQSTKIVDTSSVQDFSWTPGIIDKLLSWTGMYDNGKQLAINVCVSELMSSWKNTYDGNIVILGQPQIKAYDYVYMNDQYMHMSGKVTVRGVTHSLNIDSGFTTTITPGLIANNTLKKSGMSNVMSTIQATSKCATNLAAILNSSILYFSKGQYGIKFTKLANMFLQKKNFVNDQGKTLFNLFKSTKILTNSTKFLEEVNTVKKGLIVLKDVKEVATVISSAETALTAASAAFPPAILVTIALDIIINIGLTWIYDMFAYRNCINLEPLYILRQDGKTYPFCASTSGQKTLLPGNPVSENKDKDGEVQ